MSIRSINLAVTNTVPHSGYGVSDLFCPQSTSHNFMGVSVSFFTGQPLLTFISRSVPAQTLEHTRLRGLPLVMQTLPYKICGHSCTFCSTMAGFPSRSIGV